MKNIILYGHGGSGNHGCEAIVRSLNKIISKSNFALMSSRPEEDIKYGINHFSQLTSTIANINRYNFDFIKAYIKLKLYKDYTHLDILAHQNLIKKSKNKYNIALSIGGDNYCYGDTTIFQQLNRLYNGKNIKTAFIGCSVEPESIQEPSMLDDLKRYSLIIARESLTYDAFVKAGLNNIKLLPDPAFQLDRVDLDLPIGFNEHNTIGINLSPYIMECENGDNITMQNYERLIKHIIKTTDMQIALIPHVMWAHTDDRKPLKMLYDRYKDTGRICLIDDHNCMELKGYIARCRFMIAARTHASIAAYSTCVPTLVVGYSVKAKGIAKDIFGSYENYVLPVQSLSKEDELVNAFNWLYQHEDSIRTHLETMMPEYCERALLIKDEIMNLM